MKEKLKQNCELGIKVLTICILLLLCSYFFDSLTDFEFNIHKETIISLFSNTPKNLRVLDLFLEDNPIGIGKAVCAQ